MSQENHALTELTDSILRWRTTRLRAAGLPPALARTIAADPAYDLHALLDLVDRGCPGELALQILCPLDRDDRPC